MNAVDLADTSEDQSQENLNFVFDIVRSVADNCSNDNVSFDIDLYGYYVVLFSVLQVIVNVSALQWHLINFRTGEKKLFTLNQPGLRMYFHST